MRTRESRLILDRTPNSPSYVPTPHDVDHRISDEVAEPLEASRGFPHPAPIVKLMPPSPVFTEMLPDNGLGSGMRTVPLDGSQTAALTSASVRIE
jgi:hypothetical protein